MTESSERRFVHVELPAPSADATYEHVALVTIDRREALNALSAAVLGQLVEALERLDADPGCRCIVLTGAGERAFAAGADIGELAAASSASLMAGQTFDRWDRIGRLRTPLIAAVRGFALGGGCELAMQCDMIIAADDARLGQPEINLGVIPGAGGTQRLSRIVGKARAMELVLTGRLIDGREAEALGLITRAVPAAEVLPTALELAGVVASKPPLAVREAKAAVNAAFEMSLRDGLAYERKSFYLLFATDDREEGMAAFLEKRAPAWKGS
jgi:enoyl-CoA hydratase